MRTGRIRLTVPLLDDVIQIGVSTTLTTATIEIDKTPSTIAVRRADGKPLQAEIFCGGGPAPVIRRTVFQSPVDSLKLLRLPAFWGSGLWIITRGGRISQRTELIQLVQTIAAFGAAKQRKAHSGSDESRCATTSWAH